MALNYKQRKYCEDCETYYIYTDSGAPDDTEPCPIDAGHTTRDHVTIGVECGSCSAQLPHQ
jgi:hypothetical protein